MPIQYPEHIKNLVPYKAGKPMSELIREQGLTKVVKLASNENPLGPSPMAVKYIQDSVNELHRYTDPSCYNLVHKLSEKYKVPPGKIFCASGSDAIIQYLITAVTREGDEVLSSEGTFIGWYVNVNKLGRKSVTVPLKGYRYDVPAIIDAITPATRIIYIANPNNPTGTIITKSEYEELLISTPKDVLIIYDEAYSIYADSNPSYPRGLDYLLPNVIVLRTFSKSFGLAGLRLGVAFGDEELIKILYNVKLPFEPNLLAQAAAEGALQDDEYYTKTMELNSISLRMLEDRCRVLGITITESSANFFLMLFRDEETAASFTNECMNRGLILRHVKNFGIPNGVRINSGTIDETEFAINVITEVVEKFPVLI